MHTLVDLFQSSELPSGTSQRLAALFAQDVALKGSAICQQGAPEQREILLLTGATVSLICDAEGREVCTGLHVGPEVLPPHIARSQEGCSLVELHALTDCSIATIGAADLEEEMLGDKHVRDWANGIMRAEITRRAHREWALAALPAAERLAWFRRLHPTYEARFPHRFIASYLGMTPVTLSRLRKAAG